MVGKTISHYKILEKIGEGGMGVVYKAEDTKLERTVAIKFLPRQIAVNSEERERFKIEAKAAAALNHPNITTIHAIEEVDDDTFIVMEYIKGKELKEFTTKDGELSIDDVTNYATQIAEGLKAAHEEDVTHRDIKSANIMITDKGQVKIMDFGLAKVRGGAQVTKVGTTLGTAAYMSPEQARGEEADHRSDIWSFGVVLYEMLTGKLPFGGDYEQAVTYAILNEEPTLVSEFREDMPDSLLRVLNTTLEKDPELRVGKIDDLFHDLAGEAKSRGVETKSVKSEKSNRKGVVFLVSAAILSGAVLVSYFGFLGGDNGGPASERKMIVVLPLKNLGAAEQEYFADGITGEITSRLSGLSSLGVIARSSAMHYKNTDKTLEQIGNELNVDYVLEGTIQWEELADGRKRVRVNPELIKISNSTQIWSQPYEADFSSVFKLQSIIASQVASALDLKMMQSESKFLEKKISVNSEAYDLYLRGMEYYNNSFLEQDFIFARQMFSKAIELDPNFAAAYAQLSNVQVDMYWYYYDHSDEILKKSKQNVEKAMQLDPELSVVRAAMGWYYYHGKLIYEDALVEFYKALELQPNNADAYGGIASVLRRQGKMEQAVENFKRVTEIDPRSALYHNSTAETYLLIRDYSKADKYVDKAISLAPDLLESYQTKATIHILRNGGTTKAREVLENALQQKFGKQGQRLLYPLSKIDVLERNYQSALDHLSELTVFDGQFQYVPVELNMAQVYGFQGNENLERKYYQSALKHIENKIKENPNESRYYSSLGITLAGLGRKSDAIREGEKGVKLMPISKEMWRGAHRVKDLAVINLMIGEYDNAIHQLDQILSIPSGFSAAILRIDPTWDPIREHPRFKELLAKYSMISL